MQHNLRYEHVPVAEENHHGVRTEDDRPPASPGIPAGVEHQRSPAKSRLIAARVHWVVHWLLRLWLAGYLLLYGWSKVLPLQMGQADYADAHVQYSEVSPMGLFWRFMACSPAVQVLAGLAVVAAAAFLLVRRTA